MSVLPASRAVESAYFSPKPTSTGPASDHSRSRRAKLTTQIKEDIVRLSNPTSHYITKPVITFHFFNCSLASSRPLSSSHPCSPFTAQRRLPKKQSASLSARFS